MNKSDLVASIIRQNCQRRTQKALNIIESITGALKKGDKVQLVGFGTFETRQRAARRAESPDRCRGNDSRC